MLAVELLLHREERRRKEVAEFTISSSLASPVGLNRQKPAEKIPEPKV